MLSFENYSKRSKKVLLRSLPQLLVTFFKTQASKYKSEENVFISLQYILDPPCHEPKLLNSLFNFKRERELRVELKKVSKLYVNSLRFHH